MEQPVDQVEKQDNNVEKSTASTTTSQQKSNGSNKSTSSQPQQKKKSTTTNTNSSKSTTTSKPKQSTSQSSQKQAIPDAPKSSKSSQTPTQTTTSSTSSSSSSSTTTTNNGKEEESTTSSSIIITEEILHNYDNQFKERFELDFGSTNELIKQKPESTSWVRWYTKNLKFDDTRGKDLAEKAVKTLEKVLEDSLTAVEELILSGDVDTTKYQLSAEARKDPAWTLSNKHGLLQFAVLTRSTSMLQLLLEQPGGKSIISKPDLVTGFTALHFAVFVESVECFEWLVAHGADINKEDKLFGTPFDYAKLLGLIIARPYPLYFPNCKSITAYNEETKSLEQWPIDRFEKQFDVIFTPYLTCEQEYVFELMFSGFAVSNPDMEFRKRYFETAFRTSGDENLVLAKISETVGWGVFAAKDFQPGDFIARYGGNLWLYENIKNKSYLMDCGIYGVGLDASKYRNLSGMMNHSSDPNAESQCAVHRGVEQPLVIAKKFIPKGHQVLINYGTKFWKKKKPEDLSQVAPLQF